MRTAQINNPAPAFQSLKKINIKGSALKRDPVITDGIKTAVMQSSRLAEFFSKWDAAITLNSGNAGYSDLASGKSTVIVRMLLKYKEIPKKNCNVFKKLSDKFRKPKVVEIFGDGADIKDAGRGLAMRLWGEEFAPELNKSERQTLADIEFNKRYGKIFGVYYKRQK